MKRAVVVITCLAALALPGAAQSHGGKHWTEGQAERRLIRDDLERPNGSTINVGDAACSGFGHNFIAFNGAHVYSKFSCGIYPVRGAPFCIEVSVRQGPNATWFRDNPRFCF